MNCVENQFDWKTGRRGERQYIVIIYGNGSQGMSDAILKASKQKTLSHSEARKEIKRGARAFMVDMIMGICTEMDEPITEELLQAREGLTEVRSEPTSGPVTIKDMKTPPTDLDFIKVLEDYADIYQPLPPGLPPERELGPVIPLKPSSKPGLLQDVHTDLHKMNLESATNK